MVVRGAGFAWGTRTYVMGIVNASPDSFSGDGRADVAGAVERALLQHRLGAHVLDIGGESTRPGHLRIGVEEELRRLLPVVREVRGLLPAAVISVDTYKAQVARAALEAGADAINSIWGLTGGLLEVALAFDAPLVIMHNKQSARYEGDVVAEVAAVLQTQADRAVEAGLRAERILLDPGIGFGKTPEHNLALLAGLERIVALGFPTVLGTSRKSTVGRVTAKPVGLRTYGTAATVALAAAAGIDMVRVHDVDEMLDVVEMTDAIVRGRRPADWEWGP